jgi:hypothetical protein
MLCTDPSLLHHNLSFVAYRYCLIPSMDVATTAPYVLTCGTALFWLMPYSRKQPFESKDTCESFRHDDPSHKSLYLGLSLINSGINGYDFPKERKYYCTILIYSVRPCDCDTFGGFGISVLTIDCCDIKEISVDRVTDLVNLWVTPVNI